MHQNLRDYCKFDVSGSQVPTANSIFEPFSLGFNQTFRDAKEFESQQPQNITKKTKALKTQLAPFPNILRQSFDRETNEISTVTSDKDIHAIHEPVFYNRQVISDKSSLTMMKAKLMQ